MLNHLLHPSQQHGFGGESPVAEMAFLQSRPFTNGKHLMHHKNKTNPPTKAQDC
ncbi:hypothetical protein EXN66_Car020536 [Channa argus]|uniref:Uncharacterized protein n=1 Tax=Channa argus TaxID=215402 RepID=A0A6G1QRZ3_CHAAH|nr:hypothetical protein EXN66_Car020536 [Channa argus]